MEKRDTKILIVSGLIFLLSIGVVYFLVIPAYNQIGVQDDQIEQIKAQIDARNNYYSKLEAKVVALENAGWSEKKKSIEVNFTSSPFFVSKMNVFFRTMASGSGMTLSSITASSPTSVKAVAQTKQSESDVKISKSTADSSQQQTVQTTYLDRLQGPVKKTTFNISVSGTYNSFKKLLSDLESQTRVITVKSVSVSSSQAATGKKTSSLSSFNLVVDAYSY